MLVGNWHQQGIKIKAESIPANHPSERKRLPMIARLSTKFEREIKIVTELNIQ
jgi:hypothetical protein